MSRPALLRGRYLCLFLVPLLLPPNPCRGDTLELTDGSVLRGCYVRDEGTRLLVWDRLEAVGGPARAHPRGQVKGFKIERDAAWDAHPQLPDLSVTFIELTPKLAGLHGRVDYDRTGRPRLAGSPKLRDLGEQTYLRPEEAAKGLRFAYREGEPVTLTAHVRNVGFAAAKPFRYRWLLDGRSQGSGRCEEALGEMEEREFALLRPWREGRHEITFRIESDQAEIATINNEAADALWGWGFTFIVHKGRVAAWHRNRSAYGTFSFEDFYRWHVEIMNRLLAESRYPSAPEGIRARVRLDRIVYTDDVEAAEKSRVSEDGIRYDQGAWIWLDDQDRKKQWEPPTKEWRNQTEWSLPHELGHQLGLTDLYALDYGGHEFHVMPDNGDKVAHFMTHPMTMMHWHGPQLWSELDAGYLNMTWDRPRGHYGDFYFAIPRENRLRIVDVNGLGVPGARVEIFQRGTKVDPAASPGEEQGVRFYPVVEDGNFDLPVSKDPVMVGTTDEDGVLRLPNRPVQEVKTLNGFHRRPNPFGNINVVGQRGLMLARVTKGERPCHFWLEITDFNVAWFRGQRERFTMTLKTPYGSAHSPPAPRAVRAAPVDVDHARVTWDAPAVRDQHYLDRVVGYRIYRRVSSDGLNDRPWFPVATVAAAPEATREVLVDLRQFPRDTYWFSKTSRFAVTTVGELGVESELLEALLPN